jgi:hypothetical protein
MGVVRRSTAVLDDEDEEATGTSQAEDDGLDDEDEDEDTGRDSAVLSGKAGAQAMRRMGSNYANEFKFEKKHKSLIKFLEDESFASYRQHWVEKKGKKSYICIGKGCPLCANGDTPSAKFCFNIYSFDTSEVKALIAGPMLLDVIEDAVAETKSGKLTTGFWRISRTVGANNKTSYTCTPVKDRDLEDDFGITLDQALEAVEEAVPYKASIFKVPTRKELVGVARGFNEDDDDDDSDD